MKAFKDLDESYARYAIGAKGKPIIFTAYTTKR
jgi:hypothetical protein